MQGAYGSKVAHALKWLRRIANVLVGDCGVDGMDVNSGLLKE